MLSLTPLVHGGGPISREGAQVGGGMPEGRTVYPFRQGLRTVPQMRQDLVGTQPAEGRRGEGQAAGRAVG